jgi:predicted metal-dependent peptidase
VLLADLPRTRTPWEHVLRVHLGRALSRRVALNWSRPSRAWLANRGRAGAGRAGRLPWEPGLTASRRVPRLVVVADVSGSIDPALLARFAREIVTLTRRLEAPWTLVVGDDAVRTVRHFEPGRGEFGELPARGGGGTDFTPLLQEAQSHRPDLIVVLTDLDGPARERPRCPVLWAVPAWGAAQALPQAPFGQVLRLQT